MKIHNLIRGMNMKVTDIVRYIGKIRKRKKWLKFKSTLSA